MTCYFGVDVPVVLFICVVDYLLIFLALSFTTTGFWFSLVL